MYKLLILIVTAVCFVGCSRSDEELSIAQLRGEVLSSLTEAQAQQAADYVGRSLRLQGYEVIVTQTAGPTNSMGVALSSAAKLVFIKDFANTPINSIVFYSLVPTETRFDPNGQPYYSIGEKKYLAHQVFTKGDDTMRAKPLVGKADPGIITEQNYFGTLAAQIYFNDSL